MTISDDVLAEFERRGGGDVVAELRRLRRENADQATRLRRIETAEALITELDGIATDVCSYDYGLPLYNADAMPKMVAAVERYADAVRASERGRCVAAAKASAPHGDGCGCGECVGAWSAVDLIENGGVR